MITVAPRAEFEEEFPGGFENTDATAFVINHNHSALLVDRDTFRAHELALTEFRDEFPIGRKHLKGGESFTQYPRRREV